MSPSKMRKSQAYRDGECHADGGPDMREQHAPAAAWKPDMRPAYDLGFKDHAEYLARDRACVAALDAPTHEDIATWRVERATALTSALWEYCPEEFDRLLNAYEALLPKPVSAPAAWIDGKPVPPEALPYAVTDHVLREVREVTAELGAVAKTEDPARAIIRDLLAMIGNDNRRYVQESIAAARAFLGEA